MRIWESGISIQDPCFRRGGVWPFKVAWPVYLYPPIKHLILSARFQELVILT